MSLSILEIVENDLSILEIVEIIEFTLICFKKSKMCFCIVEIVENNYIYLENLEN
jgi:hypothetical protein